ncbi:hypothetical protein L484_024652 [Morus notabilis]|uniref:SET domain-containing protein n=1 Tax=Morus notabilis TaxID=981085 RepID=W9QZJ0_9ROSA|nr:hypothetical protein L484_024652 [Morus notabilis]
MANDEEESKLQCFLQWLQVNGVQLRGCKIKLCDSNKGFGIFFVNDVSSDGVLLVVPLNLAITPMRVLQDPLIGQECRGMFEEEEVDDRFLIILFLTIERLRRNSSWKPYLDILPNTFGNPLWFSDDELSELKGTTLYRATELQKRNLLSLYDDKVKSLVKKLLTLDGGYQLYEVDSQVNGETSTSAQGETVWVEGLVPGIDFCNHDRISMVEHQIEDVRDTLQIVGAITNRVPQLHEDVTRLDASVGELHGSMQRIEEMLQQQARLLDRVHPERGQARHPNQTPPRREPERDRAVPREESLIRRRDGVGAQRQISPGEDPYGWVFRAERYFAVNDIDDEERILAASICTEGRALGWFQWTDT